MNYEKRARIISLFVTAVITIAVIILLIFMYLHSSEKENKIELAPEEAAELLFEGEYVKFGSMQAEDNDMSEPAPETVVEEAAPDEVSEVSGMPLPEPTPDPAPLITSKVESAMKVKEQPKPAKTGPTKEELARLEREKKQKETQEKVSKRVNFGSTGNGASTEAQGQTGSPEGNTNMGPIYGQPGANLKGRTIASWSYPKSTATGSIKINIRVNRKGEVISAEYHNGVGPVASQQAARESCIKAAKKSKFSVDDDAPAEQPGSIIYTFQ